MDKVHITNAPADILQTELQPKVRISTRSCSDLLAAVITEVAMIRRVKLNPFKAPVSSEKKQHYCLPYSTGPLTSSRLD